MDERTEAMCERGQGPMRDEGGRLRPGHSGNPRGRPPVDPQAAALVKVIELATRRGQRVSLTIEPELPRAA